MDGAESLSSKSRGSMGSALGSGSLKERGVKAISDLMQSHKQATHSHTASTMCTYYGNIINLSEMQSASIKLRLK